MDEYRLEEMKLIRESINAQMRGHERLVLFQISAMGLIWWALLNTRFVHPEIMFAGSLLPIFLALYGLLNHHAMRTFIKVSDRYVKENIEFAIFGEARGYLGFYYNHHQPSITGKSRNIFWYSALSISILGAFGALLFPEYLQTIPKKP